MRNITFRAEEKLIEQARRVAHSRHQTLNEAFREWLQRYAAPVAGSGVAVDALMRRLRHIHSSGPYTRDQLNAR